ncbi:helix-turn-helix transcriptional regulator [Streptomyces zaomyceticus]|uniref:helix-turn-helix domain-containing protein n=1 Tax=Streptomyces zaomyceticus TaxID=68286 RepID=UPI002E12FE24|nr:helix-turn-helix domain-containing protein [Streptomyces zaomyceticus]
MHQAPTTLQVDGPELRKRRKAAGLEIDDLARSAGISRRYLSHLETGSRTRMRPARHKHLFDALEAAERAQTPPVRGEEDKE